MLIQRISLVVMTVMTAFMLSLLSVLSASDDRLSKELKEKLFARYDQKNLNIAHEKILVAAINGDSYNPLHYNINYDYFYPGFPLPKRYQPRNRIDQFTTEEVMSSAAYTDPLNVGEMVRVRKFYVRPGAENSLMIDFYVVALDGKRVARVQERYGTSVSLFKRDFGVHFRFILPTPKPDINAALSDIVETINRYFVPNDEYARKKQDSARAVEAQKNVNIQPGMSEEEVIRMLGEPQKRIQFGNKTILKYSDITVELEDKKVTQVKLN